MGGVINIVSSRPTPRTFGVKPQIGNHSSPKLDFFGSDVWGPVGVAVEGSAFRTDGFPIVVENERGKVDNNATVNFGNFSGKVDYKPSDRFTAFFRGGYFRENRDNAKMSTFDGTEEANSTRWKSANGGVRIALPDASSLQATVFADFETFRANTLAVPPATPPRSIGRMTLNQRVPSTGVGGAVQWFKTLGARNHFQGGVDWRWVDGESQEEVLDGQTGATVTLKRFSGGTQRSLGVFVQDVFSPVPRFSVTLSGRVDRWRNYNAHNLETNQPSGTPTANNDPALPESTDTVFSPRVAALYQLSNRVNVWGDVTSAFRAPTLNELYRRFGVGSLLTLANPQLGPERLVGGEAGVSVTPVRNVTIRTTGFTNRVTNPVSNVTISTVGQNVTVQRQNLGRTSIRGVQSDVEYRMGDVWKATGGYLFNYATVEEFAANPTLVGKFLPQVPKHRWSMRVAYATPRLASIALGVQFVGRQFDDDQNARIVPGYTEPGLPGFTLVDLMVSRPIVRNVDAFVGVQNMFDRQYFVGTLPTTIGSPLLVNGGVRMRFQAR
jgi:outer membrane receptor protein involved in Fe transport